MNNPIRYNGEAYAVLTGRRDADDYRRKARAIAAHAGPSITRAGPVCSSIMKPTAFVYVAASNLLVCGTAYHAELEAAARVGRVNN